MIVTIDKIPYEFRHSICFDCEYCYGSVPYQKECGREELAKIEFNSETNEGWCYDRVENED